MQKISIAELTQNFHSVGRVEWIGLRTARREKMESVQQAELVPGSGLQGDRFKGTIKSKRQVSLIQAEHLSGMAKMLKLDKLPPELLRRNIVISGVNLLSLKGMRFSLGNALMEMSGLCHPCSRMEETFGSCGYNVVRGHGGIIARVLEAGEIKVGSELANIHATNAE